MAGDARHFFLRGVPSDAPPPPEPKCRLCDDTGWVTAPGGGVEKCSHYKTAVLAPPPPEVPITELGTDDVGILAAYLQKYALGRRHAKTAKELEAVASLRALLGKDFARALRSVTSDAVQRMIPLVSGDYGYYYANEPSDFDDQIERMNGQVANVNARIAKLRMMQDHMRKGQGELAL